MRDRSRIPSGIVEGLRSGVSPPSMVGSPSASGPLSTPAEFDGEGSVTEKRAYPPSTVPEEGGHLRNGLSRNHRVDERPGMIFNHNRERASCNPLWVAHKAKGMLDKTAKSVHAKSFMIKL